MPRKRFEEEGINNEWMNTYADMVTLLLTFFVLLFSMSSVDADKWKYLQQAFANAFGSTEKLVISPEGESMEGDTIGNTGDGSGGIVGSSDVTTLPNGEMPKDVTELLEFITQYASEGSANNSTIAQNMEVSGGKNYVFIRFTNNIFFNPDSAVLRDEAYDALEYFGKGIKSAQDNIGMIRIEGHTATVLEDENYGVDDRTLSSDRANSVLRYLQDKSGVAPDKLSSMGYGKYRPIADNATPEGRAKNRRVEILIVDKNIDLKDSENLQDIIKVLFGEGKFEVETDYIP